MLKSLEKLRTGPVYGWSNRDACHLADKIQEEIDRFYLPRPLFEDGEPADFGDEYLTLNGSVRTVTRIGFNEDGCSFVFNDGVFQMLNQRVRLKRPPEPDSKEKIDADSKLSPFEYVRKFGLDDSGDWTGNVPTMISHLLERQRKLDGVE